MNRVYQVLVTYTTRRLHMLILFVITVSGVVMISAANAGDRGSGSSDMGLITFLLFPMVMLNQYLGAFLKQQMATYRAALIPGYRTPHLIAAALVVLFPLLVCTVTATVRSLPLPGIIGILAFAAMAGLHGGNSSQLVAWSCYAFLIATFFVPHLRAAIFEMLNGQEPGMAWSLISASVAGTALLFHRLATLTEDDPEFGRVMPMDPWDLRASAIRSQNRTMLQRNPWFSDLMNGPASRRLDRITSRPAKTIWQRVALLRQSIDWPFNAWVISFIVTCCGTIPLIPTMPIDDPKQIFRHLMMLAAIAPMGLWTQTFRRWSRLGYESLRPQTRQEWVRENALAIALNIASLQSIVICLNPILIFAFLKGTIPLPVILTAAISFVGVQLFSFGLIIWAASFNPGIATVIAVAAMCGGLASFSLEFMTASAPSRQVLIALIAPGITSVVGIAFCWMAYRRWCRIDLA